MPELVGLASTEVYQVRAGEQVTLEVTTAERQASRTSLLLNGQPHPFADGSGPQSIGSNLAGSILHARTIVRDVDPETNRAVVVYELRGGPEIRQFRFSIPGRAEKGCAHCIIAFVFTNSVVRAGP